MLIAAITSCTNTSNPAVMVAAGLLARKARALGLASKPWVKTSLAPGLARGHRLPEEGRPAARPRGARLLHRGLWLYHLHRQSGPLKPEISEAVKAGDVVACSVLSGNRNFEGRVHPEIKMNFLASPPLVVAYALAGNLDIDITTEPLGNGKDGKPVYLKDIWPSAAEVAQTVAASVDSAMFTKGYADVFKGDAQLARHQDAGGQDLCVGRQIHLREESAVLRRHDHDAGARSATSRARARSRVLGDSVTTDHISPAGNISKSSPAAKYLMAQGVQAGGLQFLRRAPRQPRSDDARHVRQHPPAQSAAAGHGGRRHGAHPERRTDVDLRRRDEVQGRRRRRW